MRTGHAIFACAGLIAAALMVLSWQSFQTGEPAMAVPEASTPRQDVPAVEAAPPSPSATRSPRTRPVAPENFNAPFFVPEELERLEPRQPLSEQAAPAPRRRDPLTRLHRPVADAAGRISSGDLTVDVAGIEIVDADETCRDEAGVEWPCGVRARTAFRAFLRGRTVECVMPEDTDGEAQGPARVIVPCRLGRVDLSEWLVENGWARPAADSALDDLGRKAEAAGRGIYSAAPSLRIP